MSDRPTPEIDAQTFDPYPWNNNGPGRSHRPEVMYPCDDGGWVDADLARRLERQRDAYAETLRVILKSAGQHVSDAIRHTHPELAGNEKSPDAGATENSALDLASRFHETYERLAPEYGYETRLDTRAFDPASKNGELMVAVCAEIIEQRQGHPRRERIYTMKENAARRWMRRLVRRLFCRHALAWVRNIHGDEINATGCRTVWICEKCGKYIYARDYITKDMACVVYDPTNTTAMPPTVGSGESSTNQ